MLRDKMETSFKLIISTVPNLSQLHIPHEKEINVSFQNNVYFTHTTTTNVSTCTPGDPLSLKSYQVNTTIFPKYRVSNNWAN